MNKVTKSKNTKLFREAEMLRKVIQSEIHNTVRNEPDNIEPFNKKTAENEEIHNNKAIESD